LNTGTISGEASTVGGIAGTAESVIHSFNMAEIRGKDDLEGIIGEMSYSVDTTIQNCYNIGTITGDYNFGGIVASASTNKALYVTDCYNHGTITANNNKGALLGYISSPRKKPILTNTYYLLGSADRGIGTGVAEYEECVVTILEPRPLHELLSETIKKMTGDSVDLTFTIGKELLNKIIKVMESFYKLLEELAASEGSGDIKYELYTAIRDTFVMDSIFDFVGELLAGDDVKVITPIETQTMNDDMPYLKVIYGSGVYWVC